MSKPEILFINLAFFSFIQIYLLTFCASWRFSQMNKARPVNIAVNLNHIKLFHAIHRTFNPYLVLYSVFL